MPRYFFDVDNGALETDPLGIELNSLGQARVAAGELASDLLRKPTAAFWDGQPWRVTVRDQWGLPVLRVDLRASGVGPGRLFGG